MITAIVLISAIQGKAPDVAEALLELTGVSEVYSVAGPHDLVAIVRVRQHEDLAELVARRIQNTQGIASTQTLIAFKAYSRRDLDAMWSVGFDGGA